MAHPFITLGVSEKATDEEAREAYLQKVREYPPERSPELFQAIAEAYEAIKDEVSRARVRVFGHLQPDTPLREFVPDFPVERRRIGLSVWLKELKRMSRDRG